MRDDDRTGPDQGDPGSGESVSGEPVSRDQINRILSAVASFYQARDVRISLTREGAIVFPDEPNRGEMHLGNILARCQATDASDWAELIEDHLLNMEVWWEQEKLIADRIDDYDFVREHLGVQLWPESLREQFEARRTVMRDDVPGAITTLVLDLPTALRTLRRSEIEAWGQADAALFDEGIERVRRAVTPRTDAIDVGLTKPVMVVRAEPPEDTFVSVFALTPQAVPDIIGSYGALLSTPCRDLIIAHPLEDASGPYAIPQMAAMLQKAVSTRPYAIAATIWHHDRDGAVTPLGYDMADGRIEISAPPAFQAVMAQLPAAPEGAGS